MRHSRTRSVGLEVHNNARAVASVANAHDAEVISLGRIGTRQADRDHLVRTLQANAPPLVCVDEAGPCGSWLSRDRTTTGQVGWGGAPARMPNKAGDRVNTERRDAGPRARPMRSGDLTRVDGPSVEDDTIRDRRRAREAALSELKTAKCRLNALLLRHAIRKTGRATWGPAHLRWRSAVGCHTPAQQLVFQADVRAVTAPTDRRQRLEQALHAPVQAWRLRPVVEAFQALHGVPFLVAVPTVAALGDRTRGDHPRALRKCRGLIPSEYASGERRRQGAITTAGNTHARRALVEGAWAYCDSAHVSRHLHRRLETHPKAIQDIRGKAHLRRCKRYRRLMARGQQANHVVVASARAWVGCMGAMARQVPITR